MACFFVRAFNSELDGKVEDPVVLHIADPRGEGGEVLASIADPRGEGKRFGRRSRAAGGGCRSRLSGCGFRYAAYGLARETRNFERCSQWR